MGLLPLLTAAVLGLGGQRRGSYWFASLLDALTVLLGYYLLLLTHSGRNLHSSLIGLQIPPSGFNLTWGLHVDFPAAVMVSLTATLSFIINGYAMAYLQIDRRRYRILISIFVSAMLFLLMADNLISLFVGWEMIGVMSYLLISFAYQQPRAAQSGTKAWLIHQLGSILLLIGILRLGQETRHFALSMFLTMAEDTAGDSDWLHLAQWCLLGGACVKSAQWPFFNWLPSAMTAPTPASALIHSATVVGAGIYLLIRIAPGLDAATLTGLAYVGSMTTWLGACAALTQQNTKKVLAYSTISQLGYVVMAIGVGASGAGLYHFVIHALAKASLFLCVGTVSRFLRQQGEKAPEDMQRMGGLRQVLPGAFYGYLLAACSLVGVPGFSSKEAIEAHAWIWAKQQAQAGHFWSYGVPGLGFITSLLTVLYLGRQGYLIFWGPPRWSYSLVPQAIYRTPKWMQVSSAVLLGGLIGLPHSGLLDQLEQIPFLAVPPISTALHQGLMLVSLLPLAVGLICLTMRWSTTWAILPLPLVKYWEQGGYLDVFSNAVAKGVLALSQRLAQVDDQLVDGLVRGLGMGYVGLSHTIHWLDRTLLAGAVQFVAAVPRQLGKLHQTTQTGHLQHALLWMFIGIVLLFIGTIVCYLI
ncbi:MAG: proton-conducting transporter membrane subunit [Roseivirga sp.]